MAIEYIERANATRNPEFRDRVRVAALQVATNVQGEQKASDKRYEKRQELARQVILMPPAGGEWLDRIVWMAATRPALNDPVTAGDAELFSALTAAWDDLAGATAALE